MANAYTSQTIIDGARNVVVLLTGSIDTANEANTVKVDVSGLAPACDLVAVDEIQWSCSGNLQVLLTWEATTDVRFACLAGQGCLDARAFGGLQNNAGAGITGDIGLATTGWASGTETYTVLLTMRKVSF